MRRMQYEYVRMSSIAHLHRLAVRRMPVLRGVGAKGPVFQTRLESVAILGTAGRTKTTVHGSFILCVMERGGRSAENHVFTGIPTG